MKHKIAVFASGYGSNFEVIQKASLSGEINAEVVLFVCDKPGARSASLAASHGIESFVFSPKTYAGKAAYEQEIVERCRKAGVELICLAGYMRIVGATLLDAYRDKIINLHPALLPSFKGEHAIEQALEAGVKVFGPTIHYVDETLDGGKIIAQKAFEYYGSDLEELTAKMHETEHILYIETIKRILR
ncbi:MAG: phosphoribosylglycinamide formyltransferase [Bacteroidales bacterium]|nr:phosphoribosylglycinamide formyltransferase [Bacteroidales bacterium]